MQAQSRASCAADTGGRSFCAEPLREVGRPLHIDDELEGQEGSGGQGRKWQRPQAAAAAEERYWVIGIGQLQVRVNMKAAPIGIDNRRRLQLAAANGEDPVMRTK